MFILVKNYKPQNIPYFMDIAKEAAYLYAYSKELKKLNYQLKKHSKKAKKHLHKHHKTKDEGKKLRHKSKHLKSTDKINKLLKRHHEVLSRLRHHYLNFKHTLKKEHKN
tara:strand:+ start:912 stop:1238 length:327 start_codon:yes stop_codon:yes gene_type:complete